MNKYWLIYWNRRIYLFGTLKMHIVIFNKNNLYVYTIQQSHVRISCHDHWMSMHWIKLNLIIAPIFFVYILVYFYIHLLFINQNLLLSMFSTHHIDFFKYSLLNKISFLSEKLITNVDFYGWAIFYISYIHQLWKLHNHIKV